MLYFENDYCEGAHPAILQKLTETNFEKVPGYGTDPYCASAREKIRAACACPDADVTFISGGTQTNAIVIASMLQRWQGVLAAATGHVAAHEAGAIEYTGHKVTSMAVGELRCEDKDGNAVHIPCDHVVMASGARSVSFDTAALSAQGIAVVKVGDCAEVADISNAIKTAYDAANSL